MRPTGKTAMLQHVLPDLLAGTLMGSERNDGAYEQLSQDDIERCMFGHVRLQQLSSILRLLSALGTAAACAAEQCVSQEACSRRMGLLVQTAVANIPVLLTTNALAGLEDRLANIAALDCRMGLCGACRERLVQSYLTTQRETWKKLPSLFYLEDEDLETKWAGCSMVWQARIR
ncbi:hypothetical protein TRAPUB_1291 [Trametes pubescens]|uniref:Uncharacterized protein n=1 Tax=Trametes pubescens TaxID=154538 RepID=A0A1M2VJQ8_TRAPU|nr:hypothetical protein TRAPUB_1291 [Trametes pubescens]